MAKKKNYYAVRNGLVPGIYTSWGDCQQNINGFPGAEYQGFSTKEEAEAYLADKEPDAESDTTKRIYSNADAVAYIAGSFNNQTNEYGYGVVLFYDGGEERYAEKFSDAENSSMRNVSGEIEGAKRAMKFCYDNGIKSIDIFYNYEGIEKWCTQAWQAKKPGTKEYRAYYKMVSHSVDIRFVKVTADLNNEYNDSANSLAKGAVGLNNDQPGMAVRNNGVIAQGIHQDDLESVLDLMKEDFPGLSITNKGIPYATQYELVINQPTKQKLSINYYGDKNKIWISGKQEDLYNRLTNYIVELLEYDEIPSFLNTVHSLDIDKDVVESEFLKFFPNSHDKLPPEIKKYLHQAVYNLHIEGKMYAANYLVEPAIRSLEGVLKFALKSNNIPIRKGNKNYDSFFVFKEKPGIFQIHDQFVRPEHSTELLKYLSRCYTYYHNTRNTLFHWDDPSVDTDTTRILNTAAEARAIIQDVIVLIDEYYTVR